MKAALTLSNDPAEAARLLEFAAAFAGLCKLPGGEAARLSVVVDELFSNVVRHGYDGSRVDGTVAVRLSFVRDRLWIMVADDGRAFDPLTAAAPDLDLPASQRPTGGLGIHFVKNLVDNARYARRRKRNCLVLVRRIDPSAPVNRPGFAEGRLG